MTKNIIRILAIFLVCVTSCVMLASCQAPNQDPDKALEALKSNGVTFAGKDDTYLPGILTLAGVKGVDCVVSGTGKIDGEYAHITIIYFDEASDANDAWEEIQDRADEEKKDAEDSQWVCKKSGKMIYYGTKNAIKAAS